MVQIASALKVSQCADLKNVSRQQTEMHPVSTYSRTIFSIHQKYYLWPLLDCLQCKFWHDSVEFQAWFSELSPGDRHLVIFSTLSLPPKTIYIYFISRRSHHYAKFIHWFNNSYWVHSVPNTVPGWKYTGGYMFQILLPRSLPPQEKRQTVTINK